MRSALVTPAVVVMPVRMDSRLLVARVVLRASMPAEMPRSVSCLLIVTALGVRAGLDLDDRAGRGRVHGLLDLRVDRRAADDSGGQHLARLELVDAKGDGRRLITTGADARHPELTFLKTSGKRPMGTLKPSFQRASRQTDAVAARPGSPAGARQERHTMRATHGGGLERGPENANAIFLVGTRRCGANSAKGRCHRRRSSVRQRRPQARYNVGGQGAADARDRMQE
jgi:hypothetical protein